MLKLYRLKAREEKKETREKDFWLILYQRITVPLFFSALEVFPCTGKNRQNV